MIPFVLLKPETSVALPSVKLDFVNIGCGDIGEQVHATVGLATSTD